jgi:hypothetical protein
VNFTASSATAAGSGGTIRLLFANEEGHSRSACPQDRWVSMAARNILRLDRRLNDPRASLPEDVLAIAEVLARRRVESMREGTNICPAGYGSTVAANR